MQEYVLNTDLPASFEFQDEIQLNQKSDELWYDLYAICNHAWNLGSGHYTAFCQNIKTKKWYDYNDAIVTEVIDPQSMIRSDAYMLFYRRRDTEDL